MKHLKILLLIFFFIVFLFFYISHILKLPLSDILLSREISLEDMQSNVTQQTSTEEPAIRDTIIIDTPETDSDYKVHVRYYIIVGSFRNLILAQKEAEKLKNDFNTNIIVLPVTKEGYYRISYGEYSTNEEAKSTITSIRADKSIDGWIYSESK